MRTNKRLKAILFDLDDTLISWEKANITSWRDFNQPRFYGLHEYLEREGHNLPPKETFADILHETNWKAWEEARQTWAGARLLDVLKRCLAACGLDPDTIDEDKLLQVYNWHLVPGVRPFPDTHDVLETLKARGYKIGLITNSYQPMWMRDIELREFDLLKYFDARITSGDTRFMKPHPAIYWRMLGLLDLTPEEAIFVGDRPANDILGAYHVGMSSVLMSPPYLNYDLEGVVPTYTIAALSELPPILEELDESDG